MQVADTKTVSQSPITLFSSRLLSFDVLPNDFSKPKHNKLICQCNLEVTIKMSSPGRLTWSPMSDRSHMFFIVARKRQMTHAKESNDMHPMEVIEKTKNAWQRLPKPMHRKRLLKPTARARLATSVEPHGSYTTGHTSEEEEHGNTNLVTHRIGSRAIDPTYSERARAYRGPS